MPRTWIVAFMLLLAIPAAAQETWPASHRESLHLRIGHDYVLPAGATVSGPVLVVGGAVTIDGRAEDDVIVIGGRLRVGPQAVVRGDVVAVGGEATIDPSAAISGEVKQLRPRWPTADSAWPELSDGGWAFLSFGITLLRLVIVLFSGIVLSLIAPNWVRGIVRRVAAAPASSAALGFAGEVLFGPAFVLLVVALAISVIGIPLLLGMPFLVAAFGIIWVAGFTATAARTGAAMRGQRPEDANAADVFFGFLALSSVTLAGHVLAMGPPAFSGLAMLITGAGVAIEYVAWTLGLGAALSALHRPEGLTAPPAVSPPTSPPPLPRIGMADTAGG